MNKSSSCALTFLKGSPRVDPFRGKWGREGINFQICQKVDLFNLKKNQRLKTYTLNWALLSISLLFLLARNTNAQTHITIRGIVRDAATQQPLQFATIGVRGREVETISKRDGSFEMLVPVDYSNDTLIISHLGYAPVSKEISTLQSVETIYLRESATFLEEVVVVHTEIRVRYVDKALRQIRGNLYAMETEVTVAQYNEFLFWMLDQNQTSLHNKCDYDLSQYDDAAKQFFKRYVTQYRSRKDSTPVKHIAPHDLSDYPAVNVPHEGALQFCEWLTDRYNNYDKKKNFRKVKFRLPTLQRVLEFLVIT